MTSILPPLYATWLGHVLPGPIPEETQATCQQCAMCLPATSAASPAPAPVFFNSHTKCAAYLPRLPNFLVGGILTDDTPEVQMGRSSVEQRIQQSVAVTPLGLARDARFQLVYREGAQSSFGRSLAWRCPHYLEDS